jgi:RNA polymerase sigma-70 factor (ECF subfamily)
MAKLVQKLGQFRGQSQFSTWLYRLTVNTCKDAAAVRFQSSRRTEPLLEDNRPAVDHDPERELAAAETRRDLARSLAELPEAQARVVTLKDALDLPFEQVAELTGLPVGTAKCYAHRARNGLRARLSA